MKKAVLIGIFSLLVYSPLRCAWAETPGDASAVKPVETSSGSTTGASNIQDPRSQAEPGVATAKNQTLTSPLTESAEEVRLSLPEPLLRAPKGSINARTLAFITTQANWTQQSMLLRKQTG